MNKVLDNNFIKQHKDLVRCIARRFLSKLPASIELDDLVQEGYLGLMQATDAFDPSHNQTFRSFATIRIRGAMMDYLRRLDPVPREERQQFTKISRATQQVQNIKGRKAKGSEIAEIMGISTDEYYRLIRDVHGIRVTDIQAEHEDDLHFMTIKDEKAIDPMDACSQNELATLLINCINRLTEREQGIFASRVFDELTLQEIADDLSVTESRICQIYNQATRGFKSYLANRGYDVTDTKSIINRSKKGQRPDPAISPPLPLGEVSLK